MRVMVCGGAGYIGSHMAKHLALRGYDVVVLDNLSTGHAAAVQWGRFEQVDVLDKDALLAAFKRYDIDVVMHFCARSLVGESVLEPYEYYRNNVVGTLNVLEVMRQRDIGKIVFSSSAAIFGNPVTDRISEDHPKMPINPYGETKWIVERMLENAANAYGLRSVSLRYFNAAGASKDAEIGESHSPETHLIPRLLRFALGQELEFKIFGTDFPTRDGTCIRDYVHVEDLALAHELAMDYLSTNAGAYAFNLGSGTGHSVLEVVEATRRVTGKTLDVEFASRRVGDPAALVAASNKAREVLGWKPEWNHLDALIESAWRWHRNARY